METLSPSSIPSHVAIIMDGNGRWATKRGLPRILGHKRGANAVQCAVQAAKKFGIKVLTLFAFSTENWNRPKEEVDYLMKLLLDGIKKQSDKLKKENVQLRVIGDLTQLSLELQEQIKAVQAFTASCTGLTLVIAMNYGGKWDILQAVRRLATEVEAGSLRANQIDESQFARYLMLSDLPPIDLLIRTGKELRLSNFMLWQLAYSELYFMDIFWPDFDENALHQALLAYKKRIRRFGRVV